MIYSTDNLIEFLGELSGEGNILPESDIFREIGMVGDDFHEMIEKYALKYNVNMDGYLWYFHADDEGEPGIGQFLFPPPYEIANRIAVTPVMLTHFANTGKWDIEYPKHDIPKRYDLLVNTIVGLIFFIAIIIYM